MAVRTGNTGRYQRELRKRIHLRRAQSAWEHCDFLDSLGFTRYCVSLKDSDPTKVVDVNRRFAERRPDDAIRDMEAIVGAGYSSEFAPIREFIQDLQAVAILPARLVELAAQIP